MRTGENDNNAASHASRERRRERVGACVKRKQKTAERLRYVIAVRARPMGGRATGGQQRVSVVVRFSDAYRVSQM